MNGLADSIATELCNTKGTGIDIVTKPRILEAIPEISDGELLHKEKNFPDPKYFT